MSIFAQAFRPVGSTKRDPVLVALWISLILLAIIWIAPFLFIVFTSLKSNADVLGGGAFVPPSELAVENYAAAGTGVISRPPR